MIVEHAENFGLAQLHQLRGRVGRATAKSVCLLLRSQNLSETARDRLALMRDTPAGLAIAATDLEFRGRGELPRRTQSGAAAYKPPNHRVGPAWGSQHRSRAPQSPQTQNTHHH